MKKYIIGCIGAVLLLTSCVSKKEEEIIQSPDDQSQEEVSIVPSFQLSKDNYKMILPLKPSAARGVIVNQLGNRLDIIAMENGLRRHSTEVFSTDKYYFREGEYLSASTVYNWLGRQLTEDQLEKAVAAEIKRLTNAGEHYNEDNVRERLASGLNPTITDDDDEDEQRDSPRYLSHILEQNYITVNEDNREELAGMSIGIAMKSVYRFEANGRGPYYEEISEKEMMKQGNKIAQTILERVREIEGLEGVPIMIGLYREQENASPVPGNFVAKTTVSGSESKIGDWETIKEENVLFPSQNAKDKYFDDYEIVSSFGKKIAEYFPNYVGYTGDGFYVDEDLKKLSIEIPIEFYGGAEIIGFSQYVYGQVQSMFPNHYDLEVKIQSTEKMESVIYRDAGEDEATVHIFQ